MTKSYAGILRGKNWQRFWLKGESVSLDQEEFLIKQITIIILEQLTQVSSPDSASLLFKR